MVGAVTSSGSYHPRIVLCGVRYGGGEKQAPQLVAGLPAGALRWVGEKGGLLLANEDVDGRTGEVPVRTDLILEEATIRLLDPLGEVREEGEAGHRRGELHNVLDLDVLALGGRRRRGLDDGEHDLVELRGGDALAATLVDLLDFLEDLEDTLLRQGRYEDDGEVGEGSQTLTDSVLEGLDDGIALVLDEVPLIHADDEPLAILLDEREDVEVLALDTAGGVEHKDTDVGVLDSADGANDRVVLEIFVDLATLADTSGIDEVEVHAELRVVRVDRVTRGACYVRDDVALLTDEGIDERRLTRIGSADDSDTWSIKSLIDVFAFGEVLRDGIEEVTRTATADSGDRHRITEPEAVELSRLIVLGEVVRLVRHEEDGLLRAAELGSDLIIEVGDAALDVDDEEDDIGFLHSDLYLLVDLAFEDIFATYYPTAGVDDGELAVEP